MSSTVIWHSPSWGRGVLAGEGRTHAERKSDPSEPRPLLALALVGTLGLGWAAAAPATTIPVGPGCSLVEAITAANGDSTAGSSCPSGSGADTIVLGADVTLTIFHNTTDGDNGLPSVTSEITVEGDGFTIARSSDPSTPRFRIFHVAASGDLTLRDVTVSNGYGNEGGSHVHRGGGIFNLGTLTLDAATVDGNLVAPQAGTPALTNTALGGGIYNAGDLTLANGSSVSNNDAIGDGDASTMTRGDGRADGGGIFNALGGSLTVIGSSIVSNEARSSGQLPLSRGGGVYSEAAAATTVVDSTFLDNNANCYAEGLGEAAGGGMLIGLNGGSLTVSGSTFLQNQAGCEAGEASGGGLFLASPAPVTLTNSTFSANGAAVLTAGGYAGGGAITASGPSVTLTHVTLAANLTVSPTVADGGTIRVQSGSVTLTNSVVGLSNPGPPADCTAAAGGLVDGGGNLGCFPTAPAVTGLASSANANGGPTATHSLSPSSNAVNAGGTCGLALDQRGISRIAACDSGAYELNPCTVDDDRETNGNNGTDDTCFGDLLYLGTPQTHLHCDPDWTYFEPVVGKTYEIKTQNLVGGADTVLSVVRACGPVVEAMDDNGGKGLASRVVVTADSPVFYDVQITEAHDSYNPGPSPPSTVEGYDILVQCIGGCDCAPPEGPDLDLRDDEVSQDVTYEACSVIRAGAWTVEAPGAVVLRAGDSVVLHDDVAIHGSLAVDLDPALLPPP